MEAYPFLFAKNNKGGSTGGWTAVSMPDFVTDKEARRLVLLPQRGINMQPGEAEHIIGEHSKLGIFDILWRRVPSGLKDDTGRPFDFFEGIILRDRDPSFKIGQEHLDIAHEAVMPRFREFWEQTTWSDKQAATVVPLQISAIEGKTPFTQLHTTQAEQLLTKRTASATASANAIGRDLHPRLAPAAHLNSFWSKPTVRGIIIVGAVATVAVGAFMMAQHQRQINRQKDTNATLGR